MPAAEKLSPIDCESFLIPCFSVMFYHLFKYLDRTYDLPGSGMFQYLSFRAAAAVIV